jgi:hypothetical protein
MTNAEIEQRLADELDGLADAPRKRKEIRRLLEQALASLPDALDLIEPVWQAAFVSYYIDDDIGEVGFESWMLMRCRRDIADLVKDAHFWLSTTEKVGPITIADLEYYDQLAKFLKNYARIYQAIDKRSC